MTPHEFGISYAGWGMGIFPLHYIIDGACSCGDPKCTNQGKHPHGRLAPQGCKSATRDPAKIERTFKRTPYNIAIATGAGSGIVVLDVDPRHGGDKSLSDLARQHGALPHTPTVLTGGGGWHLYFRHPGGIVPNSSGTIADGLDIRGDGGYVVAPPSGHLSGRPYAWDVDAHIDDTLLAEMPEWLLKAAKVKKRRTTTEWRKLVHEGVGDGHRNTGCAAITGHLLRKDVDAQMVRDLVLAWNAHRCKPPLPDSEVLKTVESICSLEIARRKGLGL
jgi:Bifunctional DNA primase/polymerase, N-terminal/Primase C terminal 1 (PriCT-1)